MPADLSPVIPAEQLYERLDDDNLLIVDVSSEEEFQAGHIPGAVQLDYAAFVAARPPVMGLIPDAGLLSLVFSAIGLTDEKHVVAYDREGGGKAGRLLFTLDAIGHTAGSLLDGGMQAWLAAGHGAHAGPHEVRHSQYSATIDDARFADKDYIIGSIYSEDVVLLDCRTEAEYSGLDVRAARGGHIPRAVNINWTDTFDPDLAPKLMPEEKLKALFSSKGVTPDKEVIVYCQTHHRSSHTYMVLKQLGYPRVKGYPGAWSEWGNDPDTPVEN